MRKNYIEERMSQRKKEITIVKSWRWRITKLGLAQCEFSSKLGIHSQTLSTWINGHNHPRIMNIQLVENALIEMGV